MNSLEMRIKLRRKRMHREYYTGQKVRCYLSWFNHNDAMAGWYHEGEIESIEDQPIRGKYCNYRITKVVCDGTAYPHSWMVGKMGVFCSDSSYVFVLHSPEQPTMAMITGQPMYK